MFKLLFGTSMVRWLEGLAEDKKPIPPPAPSRPYRPGPTPEIDLLPPTVHDFSIPDDGEGEWVFPRVERNAMGSQFEVFLAGKDRDRLVGAGQQALDEVERLERQLSHYLPDSDTSRLNRYANENWVRVEPQLFALLKRCKELTMDTDGAFDITTSPLVKAWGFFKGDHRIPSEEEINELLKSVGSYRILLDEEEQLVHFPIAGTEVAFGAVGKGLAVDRAVDTLRYFGVGRAVLHGGQSTIFALGTPPSGDPNHEPEGWEFTIKDPRDRATPIQKVTLRNEALSTSGDYEQFFERDGKRYSHILDPLTGLPVEGTVSVSVVAPTAELSDALSTAFFVLGPEATEEYCKSRPNIRVILMQTKTDGKLSIHRIGLEETNE